MPDTRMPRGIRISAWYLLLMAILWIRSKCESLRDPERLARRHHALLIETLGIELKHTTSDSPFSYLFLLVDLTRSAQPSVNGLSQMLGVPTDLDRLVCDGNTLRGSIEATTAGGSAFIAQVTLYTATLDLAFAQGCYATNQGHEDAEPQEAPWRPGSWGRVIQVDALHRRKAFFYD